MTFDFSRNLDSGFIFANKFPHPFFDIANTFLPREINKTFQWCEFIYFSNGVVRSATARVARYFVTDIKYDGENTGKTEKIDEILREDIKIKKVLTNIAIDFLVYGNSFVAIYLPTNRFLKCPECGNEYNIKNTEYKFSGYKFHYDCPKCSFSGPFEVVDRKDRNPSRVNVIRVDPKEVEINHNPFTGESEYYWNIPKDVHRKVIDQNKFVLNSIPMEILEAIEKKKKFKFNDEVFFHLKDVSLAGVGQEWGFPNYLGIMKLNYYSAVLRRANEAIALDFVIPFRVISPSQSSPQGDPISTFPMQKFVSEMQFMVLRHRYDPANVQISPFPLSYQAFGAEKKALDLTGEIQQVNEEMLHSLDYPAELFFNTLQIQAMPTALRLFENSFTTLISGMNDVLEWIVDHVTGYLGYEDVDVSLVPVTVADDIEKRQVFLQLASAQQLSMLTALKSYGIDYEDEQKNLAYQAQILQKIQQQFAEDMKNSAQIAGSPESQQAPVSPFDLQAQAEQMAQTMLSVPYEQRRSQLMVLGKENPTLHALVKEKMDKIRQTSRTQQGYEALMQMGMGGAGAPMGGMMPPG